MKIDNNTLIKIIFSFEGPSGPSTLNNEHKINLFISDLLFTFSEGEVLYDGHILHGVLLP